MVEEDPGTAEDYRYALGATRHDAMPIWVAPGMGEDDLFGLPRLAHEFPPVDLEVVPAFEEAEAAVQRASQNGAGFSVAFVALDGTAAASGLETAQALRAVDPNLMLVLAGLMDALDPMRVARQVPPAHRLFVLSKPFAPFVVRQMALSLFALRRALQRPRHALPPNVERAIAERAKAEALCCVAHAFSELAARVMDGRPDGPQARALLERMRVVEPEPWEDARRLPLDAILTSFGADAVTFEQGGFSLEVIHGAGLWPVTLGAAHFHHTMRAFLSDLRSIGVSAGALILETRNVRAHADKLTTGLGEGDYVCLAVRLEADGLTIEWDSSPFVLAQARLHVFAQQTAATMVVNRANDRGGALELYFPWPTQSVASVRQPVGPGRKGQGPPGSDGGAA